MAKLGSNKWRRLERLNANQDVSVEEKAEFIPMSIVTRFRRLAIGSLDKFDPLESDGYWPADLPGSTLAANASCAADIFEK
jgi:hypothetical protein